VAKLCEIGPRLLLITENLCGLQKFEPSHGIFPLPRNFAQVENLPVFSMIFA